MKVEWQSEMRCHMVQQTFYYHRHEGSWSLRQEVVVLQLLLTEENHEQF